MGTPLGSTSDRVPSLKLRDAGDKTDFAVIDIETIPLYKWQSQEVEMSPSGKPRTQIRLTVLHIKGDATIAEDQGDRPADTDEMASVYIARRDRWDKDQDDARKEDPNASLSWSGAVDRLDNGLQVGDVVRWSFEGEIPGRGTEDRKVRTFRIRRPAGPEEMERAQRCEALHAQRHQGTSLSEAHPSPGGYEEDPF